MSLSMRFNKLAVLGLLIATFAGACGAPETPTSTEPPEPLAETPAEPPPEEPTETASATECDYEVIAGLIDNNEQWASGWIDFENPQDFAQGGQIRLEVGGEAKQVVVRLLPAGDDPNEPQIMVKDASKDPASKEAAITIVPEDGVIELILDQGYTEIRQISVHGGDNPFEEFDLGQDNGVVILENAEQCMASS